MEKQVSTEWVTVAVASRSQEAYMLKSVLEEEGISVFLKGEITAGSYVNPMGGIELQVPDVDADRATKLLEQV